MTVAGQTPEPVRVFCTELRHLVRRSSLSASAAARRLHMSRSQYYAILNGEVRRPPDWAKVEIIVRMCGESEDAVSAWRRRHDRLVADWDRWRATQRDLEKPETPDKPGDEATHTPTAPPAATHAGQPAQTTAPPTGEATPPTTAPASQPAPPAQASASQPAPPAQASAGEPARAAGAAPVDAGGEAPAAPPAAPRRPFRRKPLALALVVVLAALAVLLGIRVLRLGSPGDDDSAASGQGPRTGSIASPGPDGTIPGPVADAEAEPGNPLDVNERDACVNDAPAGSELLDVPREHRPGNNKINHEWWGSAAQVSFNGYTKDAFDANVAAGTEQVWDALILHACIPLVKGRTYELTYRLAVNPPGPLPVRVQDAADGGNRASYFDELTQYTASPSLKRVQFTAEYGTRASELLFQVGGHDKAFRIVATGISLKEVPGPQS